MKYNTKGKHADMFFQLRMSEMKKVPGQCKNILYPTLYQTNIFLFSGVDASASIGARGMG